MNEAEKCQDRAHGFILELRHRYLVLPDPHLCVEEDEVVYEFFRDSVRLSLQFGESDEWIFTSSKDGKLVHAGGGLRNMALGVAHFLE